MIRVHWTKHIAGPMENSIQECIVCGKILIDYRNVMVPEGSGPLRAWPLGPVYLFGNVATSVEPDDPIRDCQE